MTRLKGKVKFFDAEKGYGYICDLENEKHDYKVNIANVVGVDVPKSGDIVSFSVKKPYKDNQTGLAVYVRVKIKYIEKNITKKPSKPIKQNYNYIQGGKKGDFVLDPSVNIKKIIQEQDRNDPRTECPHCGCIAIHRVYRDGLKRCVKCDQYINRDELVQESVKTFVVIVAVVSIVIAIFASIRMH